MECVEFLLKFSVAMAYKCREEIVGKRFLSVSGFSKLKSGKISEWGWRSGVVRAATHRDNTNQDLQVNKNIIRGISEWHLKRGCVPTCVPDHRCNLFDAVIYLK